jgi:nucleoside 2-deoxyribosyltransferase
MSFKTEEEPHLIDYYRAMERAAARAGVKLQRVDLIEGDYEISKKIMDEIDACDAVLADFTLSSRNVYFELGYARGKKKSIVQTARKETVLEFDIRNWKTHFYRNATELEEKLVPAFSALHD